MMLLTDYLYTSIRRSSYGPYRPSIKAADSASLHRLVYWPEAPDGGVGVSYLDPINRSGDIYDDLGLFDACSCYSGYYRKNDPYVRCLWESNAKVLAIGEKSDDFLGRFLFEHVFKDWDESLGVKAHWRSTTRDMKSRSGEILYAWERFHVESSDEEEEFDDEGYSLGYKSYSWSVTDEMIPNDYTSRAYNYLCGRRFVEACEFYDNQDGLLDALKRCFPDAMPVSPEKLQGGLLSAVKQYDYFTDSSRVSRKFGYWSPAYAVALYLSLERHGLLSPAMRRYVSFLRYHPYDPIIYLSEQWAFPKCKGLFFQVNGRDPVAARKWREEQEEKARTEREKEEWESEDDRWGQDTDTPYYVDDCPVYGADDEDDAAMIYWNTH